MLDAARGITETIIARAAETEANRSVPDDLAATLADLGVYRMYLPRSLDGGQISPAEAFEVIEALCRADGSTGWTSFILNTTFFAAWLDPSVAKDILATKPGSGMAGLFGPLGRARREEGSVFRLDGRWPFNSGSPHATWFCEGAFVVDDLGNPQMLPEGRPDWRFMFVPAEQVVIQDNWHVAGLRGTASNDVVIDGVLVPEERTSNPIFTPAVRRCSTATCCRGVGGTCTRAVITSSSPTRTPSAPGRRSSAVRRSSGCCDDTECTSCGPTVMNDIDFGIHLGGPTVGDEPRDSTAYFRHALQLGEGAFRFAFLSDHLQKQSSPIMEGWTALTYLSALAPTYTFANLVLGQSYRNPGLLAKMAATLQQLTGGRVILGLGAGWQEDEYVSYDYAFPAASVRIAQLSEAIDVIRSLWTQSPATYTGMHYRVTDAYCEPQPAPTPPILVGGQGPKLLRVVAERADMWHWDGPLEMYEPPLARLRGCCREIGRDMSTIRLVAGVEVYFPRDVADFPEPYWSGYGDFMTTPLGPRPADAIREIERLRGVGVSMLTPYFWDHDSLARFAEDVVPHC